jgi:hypothetical protein
MQWSHYRASTFEKNRKTKGRSDNAKCFFLDVEQQEYPYISHKCC